jgi:hypothetical protein
VADVVVGLEWCVVIISCQNTIIIARKTAQKYFCWSPASPLQETYFQQIMEQR